MPFRTFAALALAALLSLTFATAQAAPRNWNQTITVTPAGNHVLGNPDAPVKLVEFVSYTCPHCSHFEKQADSAMRLAYVAPGKLSIEVRNFVRDPVDLAVALLTNCGPASKFFLNHTAFMRSQDTWIQTLAKAGPTQMDRWYKSDLKERMRYIATDFHFYEIIATRGYTRQQADACLADEAMARRLSAQTAESEALGVSGTPSFMINGVILVGTHDWRTLDLQLSARM